MTVRPEPNVDELVRVILNWVNDPRPNLIDAERDIERLAALAREGAEAQKQLAIAAANTAAADLAQEIEFLKAEHEGRYAALDRAYTRELAAMQRAEAEAQRLRKRVAELERANTAQALLLHDAMDALEKHIRPEFIAPLLARFRALTGADA